MNFQNLLFSLTLTLPQGLMPTQSALLGGLHTARHSTASTLHVDWRCNSASCKGSSLASLLSIFRCMCTAGAYFKRPFLLVLHLLVLQSSFMEAIQCIMQVSEEMGAGCRCRRSLSRVSADSDPLSWLANTNLAYFSTKCMRKETCTRGLGWHGYGV
jgi:hypothetical protein